ncbi:crotonase/enoyl-CoA hydratase family protein [Parasphingorhabdus sp.]|uniref:crotonase/enoyl-CoA hydratase family protein n=1 Tax=Parasphingorhabdus sp. TaxID=2709688 RepID=UPI003A8D1E85
MTLQLDRSQNILTVTIDRPERRNAVDADTAKTLYDTFTDFDRDDSLSVAILTGAGGNFCAGADLKAVSQGNGNPVLADGDMAPMGPGRLQLSKPVIAAVEGFAVAGGLELALWCDLRVAAQSASFGVFCRRWGVPLIDLGTIRLPRLIGQSRAADMILTGREVKAEEALSFGLVNRLAPDGEALAEARKLAAAIAAFPQRCLRSDRRSMLDQWDLSEADAIRHEIQLGLKTIKSGETRDGATEFAKGRGRHGEFDD